MPKIVDHEKQRTEIAEALWRVLEREGSERVTARSVAAEWGRPRGVAEHYFTSKREMLRYACRLARERVLARLREHHDTFVGSEALRAVLLDDLGLSGDRHKSAGIWLGLLSIAARDERLAAEYVQFDEAARFVVAEIIAEMIVRGEAPAEMDPETVARQMLALHLGTILNVRMLSHRYPPAVVAAEVDTLLAALGVSLEDRRTGQ